MFQFCLLYTSQQEIEEESGALVEADGEAMKEDCYYLMEVNGYVVVYLSDKVTPYEYTAIAYDELPPTVRAEVRNGKYIESPEELYGFCLLYTSIDGELYSKIEIENIKKILNDL